MYSEIKGVNEVSIEIDRLSDFKFTSRITTMSLTFGSSYIGDQGSVVLLSFIYDRIMPDAAFSF